MTDYLTLALTYGGFTSLDKVYLTHVLEPLTESQKLAFITPPPSVINAYFAELYQKQGVEAAMRYFFDLSSDLGLMVAEPSFQEEKPFIRLNVSGKSFGLAYVNDEGLGRIFAEGKEEVTPALLFELAQIFSGYTIYEEEGKIFLTSLDLDPTALEEQTTDYLLTSLAVGENVVKLSGMNIEEVMEAACLYRGRRYYQWEHRLAILYIMKQ